jgi:hypothetical protein
MEPEISRRCKACGAAIRSRAGFCPQCGAVVVAGTEAASAAPAVELPETTPGREEPMPTPVSQEVSSPEAPLLVGETVDASVAAPEEIGPTSKVSTDEVDARAKAMDGSAGPAPAANSDEPTRRHRVKVAARDAMEGRIAPRVEKMRRASTVVLDEAADDPGLRFVLVAALLIILSLGLVLLNQILK